MLSEKCHPRSELQMVGGEPLKRSPKSCEEALSRTEGGRSERLAGGSCGLRSCKSPEDSTGQKSELTQPRGLGRWAGSAVLGRRAARPDADGRSRKTITITLSNFIPFPSHASGAMTSHRILPKGTVRRFSARATLPVKVSCMVA